jgi:hypothetical protein
MKKNLKSILFLVILIAVLVIPYFVFADSALDMLKAVGSAGGFDDNTDQYTASGIVGTAVNVFFSILGIIFIVLMLFAGYNWMTAAGDNAKVDKAKSTIWRAVIGLIITVSSWAIWDLIFTKFLLAS